MTMPTKEQIDALVEAMPHSDSDLLVMLVSGKNVSESCIRESLYLAAGLNADGSEKAKRAQAVLYFAQANEFGGHEINGTWDGTVFTPDGAP